MKPVLRFAPSPTGNIHIGNARTALINWIVSRRESGSFILRFDDTDRDRSKQEFADGILRDLAWLGITPDRIEKQSARMDRHSAATQKLKDAGLLYACYETPDEIERKRKRQAARGLPPVYDRASLKLSDDERAKLEASGRRPHWRFLLPNFDVDPFKPQRSEVHWDDLIRGPQTVDLASMSDPVLVREDGTWPYTLPSVADDADMGVTHVIRGDDHLTNAARHSSAENVWLPVLAQKARGGFVAPRRLEQDAMPWLQRLAVRCAGGSQAVGELSGGNQQKVALARLLATGCEVLLLDEPTRGVDVAAKAEIYAAIDELAHRHGTAVLVVSSYLPELLGIADRIAVVCRGEVLPARPVGECDEHALLAAMTTGALTGEGA